MKRGETLRGLLAGMLCAAAGMVAGSAVFGAPAEPALAVQPAASVAAENLPPAVARAIPSVVALQRLIEPLSAPADGPNGVLASGVIINDEMVLTAAHVVTAGGRLACGYSHVDAPGAGRPDAASREPVQLGAARYGGNRDIAVLKLSPSQNFRQLPDAQLATTAPRKGETVYFVNYQPSADGRVRSPYVWSARHADDQLPDGLAQPAIFKGVILGATNHGYMVAANFADTYGRNPDRLLGKGGSGGAVMNARGELVGLSVSTTSLTPNHSAAELAGGYGVRLPAGQYQVSRAQAVTEQAVSGLQSRLARCE